MESPGKLTSSRAPSVFTSHAAAVKVAAAWRISSGRRGSPGLRGERPSSSPGTSSGASQNAYHFSRSITSGVIVTPSWRSGWSCCSLTRRSPVVTSNSGARFRASVVHRPLWSRAASSRTTGCPPSRPRRMRSGLSRSPCHVTTSPSGSPEADSPTTGLYSRRSQVSGPACVEAASISGTALISNVRPHSMTRHRLIAPPGWRSVFRSCPVILPTSSEA